MTEFLKRAFDEGTQITRFNVLTAAIIGASAHFGFYFVFKYIFGLSENFYIRMIAVAICISLFFINHIPDRAKQYLPFYWHAGIIIILPFIFTFNLLITDFHELWRYWTIFMVCVVIVYIPNLFMILLDLTIGVALAIIVFVMTTPEIELHPNFNIPLFSIVVVFTIASMYLFSRDVSKGVREQEHQKQEALRTLAASIAHEMRNPLSQLTLSLEAVATRLPRYDPGAPAEPIADRQLEEIYRLVSHGKMAAARGAQVIDMLLNEVHDKPIDANEFTPLSAAQALYRAVDEYGYDSSAQRARVVLHMDQDFLFIGDETLLVFILFNLLKNSLYYLSAQPNGRIEITLRTGENGNVIVFRDNGPGISPEAMSHLFDPFYTRDKKGGSGLGLAYCRRVMRAFGGEILCSSEPDRFTEFTLILPTVAPDGQLSVGGTQARLRDERFVGRRLLVVDDEPLQRVTTAGRLRALGSEVVEVGDGPEAIEALRERPFDIVLMDLNMPLMSGYETAAAIRSGEAGEAARGVPIIACTSEPEYLARGRSLKAGMQGLLTKPCGESQFIGKVAALFDVRVTPAAPETFSIPPEGRNDGVDRKTLLLVDDSSSMRRSLELFLSGEGFEVLQAGGGEEALAVIREHPCDLVITDMTMPGMDGFELTRRIRADETASALPIVGLSGFSEGGYEQAAREAGIDGYLDKGADLGEMVDLVRSLLSSRRDEERSPARFDPERSAAALGVARAALPAHLEGIPVEYRDHPRRMREALLAEDWEQLRQLAHKPLGLAKLIRFPALAALAEAVEGRARERGGDGMEAAVERLCAALSGLVRDIEGLQAPPRPLPSPPESDCRPGDIPGQRTDLS